MTTSSRKFPPNRAVLAAIAAELPHMTPVLLIVPEINHIHLAS
jgi:hypothetical protein